MPNNNAAFSEAIGKFKAEIYRTVTNVTKAIVKDVYTRIVNKSPVWTGSYVSSHRIGIDKIDGTITDLHPDEFTDRFPPQADFMEAERFKAEAMDQKFRMDILQYPLKKVIISNSIHYADKVEYLGWKKTPAYHVYGLSREETVASINTVTGRV